MNVRFDAARADRAQAFFERLLVHTKGRWARQPFTLAPWQRDEIVRPLFGTVRFDEQLEEWVRAYRLAWIELGRGNGKTEILAGIGLVLLVGDDEEGAEVYGAAADREQASHVFRVAARMVEFSPVLSRRLKVIESRKTIVDPKTDSFYRTIAADHLGNLGQNPHGIVFDEVIAQPSRDLWDALRTGMGKRTQPLMIAATTAGNDPGSFAAAEHGFCERVALEPDLDPTRLVFTRNTPPDADPWDEKTWQYANPALGEFLSLQTLRDEAREAKENPAFENTFRQFRLNQWVQQASRWLPLDLWDASAGMVVEDDLVGRTFFGGLDVATLYDVAALCWDFPADDGSHDVIWRFWLPESRLPDLDRRTGNRASVWRRQGYLRITEGNVIDYKAIREAVLDDAQRFGKPVDIGFDRWGAEQLAQELDDAGIRLVRIGQGFASLSPPMKEWDRLVRQQLYRHGGNPVMRWMVNGLAVKTDPAGNVKPDKARSGDKIDGVVAAIMALDRTSRRSRGKSIYESRGMEAV